MNVLIAFATTEGQTRKIARYTARSLEGAQHAVQVHDCSDESAPFEIAEFDAVILAASVHHKRYQNAFYRFVDTNLAALHEKPVALVSVSLAVTLASGAAEARSYVDEFTNETGLKTDAVHLAEGAIRYFEYSASEASTINLVVFKGQKKMPARNGNPEYTDWKALEAFALSFLDEVAGKVSAKRPQGDDTDE